MKSRKSTLARCGASFSRLPIIFAVIFTLIFALLLFCQEIDVDLQGKILKVIGDSEFLVKVYVYTVGLSATYLEVLAQKNLEFLVEYIDKIPYVLFACAVLYLFFNAGARRPIKLRNDGTVNAHVFATVFALVFAVVFTVLNFWSYQLFADLGEDVSKAEKIFTYGFLVLAVFGGLSVIFYLFSLLTKKPEITGSGVNGLNSLPTRKSTIEEADERIAKIKALRDAGTITNAQYDQAVNDILSKM